jgi:Uma2 family endonuclease
MTSTAERLMSLDEFLVWEREQPERYEFADGVVTMMTGGSLDHVTIAMNIARTLRQALRAAGCRAFVNDVKVIAAGSVRYPDVAITCSPVSGRDDVVPEPVVIFEVISPSTERVDRGRKKFDYLGTPSIRHYAIVDQDERRIDLYTRAEDGWKNEVVTEGLLKLTVIDVEIPLDAIYEDTELDATRRPASEGQTPAA